MLGMVDVTCDSLLGGPIDPFTKPITKKTRVREKFQRLLDQEYKQHKLVEKLKTLMEKGTQCIEKHGILTNELEKEYEKLSKILEQTIKYANKHRKKATTGKVPFCKKNKELQGAIVVWKAILSHKSGKRRNLHYIL